ncbi:hypothetical protein [Stratiformator vulcanicus]|uniref:Uncharacterized protein n=1 Tax=Stratiformator vulcanicus TaxID=2527980 RepID=A0A517R2H9_9PLAN|nr:hypothetical protein [Stratiformator vulcanicus]QDT38068.1 hypothetical protein Pan189_24530 [Stratiformator vulcanicus]
MSTISRLAVVLCLIPLGMEARAMSPDDIFAYPASHKTCDRDSTHQSCGNMGCDERPLDVDCGTDCCGEIGCGSDCSACGFGLCDTLGGLIIPQPSCRYDRTKCHPIPQQGILFGLLPPEYFLSDHCFDDFIQPVTNPVYATDPRSFTRARFLFISQTVPEDIFGGGDFQVYALQATFAINERFAIIAEKDGFIVTDLPGLAPLGVGDGWANIALGAKYVALRDVCNQQLLTVGLMYETATGEADALQSGTDGIWNFFASYGKEIFDDTHFVGVFGWSLPNNGSLDSESIYYSAHLDHEVFDGIYALVEFNGRTYIDGADEFPLPIEGFDLINLGAAGVDGQTTVTAAIGGAYKPNPHLEFAAAWEFPISSNRHLFDNRTTVGISLIY